MNTARILSGAIFLCAFVMILLGGIVHNTGSSLACPDWPLCFGQVFPKMEGAVGIEHSHRLLGAFIGILCIALVWQAWRNQLNPVLKKLAVFILVAVCVQGLLGGLTVILRLSPALSTAHLGLSQIFIATVFLFFIRSAEQGSLSSNPPAIQPLAVPAKVQNWLKILIPLTFLQILWGAFIRHGGAATACGLGTDAILGCQTGEGSWSLWSNESLATQFHMAHRYLGWIVAIFAIAGSIPAIKWAKSTGQKDVRLSLIALHITITSQVILGYLTVLTHIAPWVVLGHLLFAMLLWLCLIYVGTKVFMWGVVRAEHVQPTLRQSWESGTK